MCSLYIQCKGNLNQQLMSCVENPTLKKKKFLTRNIRKRFHQFREALSCPPYMPNLRTTLIKSLCYVLKILLEKTQRNFGQEIFFKAKRIYFSLFFFFINKQTKYSKM